MDHRRTGGFLLLWLAVGFTLGTATLLGPVRWIARIARDGQWDAAVESWLVRGVIVLLVAASAAVTWVLGRLIVQARRDDVRYGIPALAVVSALASLWLWLHPGAWIGPGDEAQAGAFTFGPFPSEQRLAELKQQGYTGVVSLLHPAVVPFESVLIGREREAVERAGLRFVHAPMLPWVSDNREALARLQALARDGGRYYVHCYLGQDRIRVARRAIAAATPAAALERDPAAPEEKHLADGVQFERGRVYYVGDGVFLTPYPTDDEMLLYILPGPARTVVSLLDPDHPDDADWIEKERALLTGNGLDFVSLPVPRRPLDPARVLEVAREVAALPKPVVVHAFLGVDTGRSSAAEAFLQAYRSGLPPLPPSRVARPIERGPVRVVAPNVAVGPMPAGREFGAVLERRGIRSFLYLGDANGPEAQADAEVCRQAGIDWRAMAPDSDWLRVIARGGPWYVYGPGAEPAAARIEAELGPAIPPEMRYEWPVEAANESAGIGERLAAFVPSARQFIVLAPTLLLLSGFAAAWAGWLRTARGMPVAYTRKIFHFVIFTTAAVLHVFGGLSAVVVLGIVVSALVLYAVYRGDGFPFYEALARETDAPHRTLFVLVPLATTAAGGVAANLLFPAFAHIGYLVAGWGDAIAEPVGRAWGRHRYHVPSLAGVPASRSLEGSAAVVVVGTIAAVLGLLFSGFSLPVALGVGFACALAGAAVEVVSHHGLDNLTIQVVSAGVAFLFLG